ncbi:hypothetical protein Pan189_12270 [Stratiformator vulcanicus]|uniref:Activator of Hsp90 ATPase homologue 1/2-like C-terminal domain-containing protein n=1 Tax=Stratiformator vulcanicus TaxID=2527980 RepID=A0A517QZ41_9PLAN|nr:hypothetical protein Pan189_12270 [Stratiformator vulcanicus]
MNISVETTVDAPIDNVWEAWITPEHINRWNFASEDWQCPKAEIDLTVGGRFKYRMESKDGSMGFDFEGTFTAIEAGRKFQYSLDDDRKVTIGFEESKNGVVVVETFEAEDEHSGEQQRQGWQSILNNFKSYVEASST